MIIKIIDIHNNRISIAGIEGIREDEDGMINLLPALQTTMICINGDEVLRSARPSFDTRMIKTFEIIV